MKRRTSSDTLIPVRLASFLSAAIWESERNMETRFMPCIYVRHIILSSTKRTRIENKSVGLESLLHASRRANPQQTFRRSSAEFAEIVAAVVIAKNREIVRGKLRSVRGRVVRSREQGITWTPLGTHAPFLFFHFCSAVKPCTLQHGYRRLKALMRLIGS